jgi:hypothetical protein
LLNQNVIPEYAVGGYPESRKNKNFLDTGSRPPQADSSGMTINRFCWIGPRIDRKNINTQAES